MDNSAATQLTTVVLDGKRRDVVAVASKTGFLYVFDRVTGEPIWPIEERRVAQSEMPGQQSWPTQPFPTNPPPFSQHWKASDGLCPAPAERLLQLPLFLSAVPENARSCRLMRSIDDIRRFSSLVR